MAGTPMTIWGRRLMLSRRAVVLGSTAVVLTSVRGFAAEQSAQVFLAGIYAAYTGKAAKGIRLGSGSRGAYARYFTPGLARLLEADVKAAARKGEIPTLGADPFI